MIIAAAVPSPGAHKERRDDRPRGGRLWIQLWTTKQNQWWLVPHLDSERNHGRAEPAGAFVTLASKGSRRIVIDGLAFRWLVRRRPTYCQALGWSPLTFVAELHDESGALLVVTLPYAHPGNWRGLPTAAVRPATVAAGIRKALAAGWQPRRPGAAFTLSLDEAPL